ncbi:MAG: GNAT family N-acetyltransferase [Calditrichota bacterium]
MNAELITRYWLFKGGSKTLINMHCTDATDSLYIRPLLSMDRAWAADLVSLYFGAPCVVSKGVLHEAGLLPGLVAELEGKRVGLLQYNIQDNQCEVVILIAVRRRRGIGCRLVKSLFPVALAADCERLWAVAAANNQTARLFFKAIGWLRFDESGVKYLW